MESLKELPTKKDPSFRFFPLNKAQMTPVSFSEEKKLEPFNQKAKNQIVFSEGYFQKEHSFAKECDLLSLDEAKNVYSALVTHQLEQTTVKEKDFFASLNAEHYKAAAFLYVPPEEKVELELIYYATTNSTFFPRLHIVLGKGAEAKIDKKFVLKEGASPNLNEYIYASLEPFSKLFVHCENQESLNQTFSHVRAVQKEESFFEHVVLGVDSILARREYQVSLAGEGARCSLMGSYDLKEKKEVHTHVKVTHKAENTVSNQLFKAVLHDQAKHSFDGKIYVEKQAQKTEAYQLNNVLLLSDNARSFSQPNLEIFADDVKASHGATVGQLDQEVLFFMESRGIKKSIARQMLIEGFLEEVKQTRCWIR